MQNRPAVGLYQKPKSKMTKSARDELDATLRSLSRDTWERLSVVSHLSALRPVRFGEETITDLLMLELNRQPITRSVFMQTSKRQEALSGTDFECWLGSDDIGWVRLAFQAKKLDLKLGRYTQLNHETNGSRQIDRLVQYATHHGAIPMYCFYNFYTGADRSEHWHCCKRNFRPDELGCTIAPASTVRNSLRIRGGRSFEFVHKDPDTIPWRCLASCPRASELFHRFSVGSILNPSFGEEPFLGVEPRVYRELPDKLRLTQPTETPSDRWARVRRILRDDPLESEFGLPRWSCILETRRQDLTRSPLWDWRLDH